MNVFARKEEIHEALTTLGKQMALAYAGNPPSYSSSSIRRRRAPPNA